MKSNRDIENAINKIRIAEMRLVERCKEYAKQGHLDPIENHYLKKETMRIAAATPENYI